MIYRLRLNCNSSLYMHYGNQGPNENQIYIILDTQTRTHSSNARIVKNGRLQLEMKKSTRTWWTIGWVWVCMCVCASMWRRARSMWIVADVRIFTVMKKALLLRRWREGRAEQITERLYGAAVRIWCSRVCLCMQRHVFWVFENYCWMNLLLQIAKKFNILAVLNFMKRNMYIWRCRPDERKGGGETKCITHCV